MGIPYRISKGFLGDKVHYKCPACRAELTSKFNEIGSSDYCPICGSGFTVPGEEEIRRREHDRSRKEAEQKQRDEENQKHNEDENRQIVPVRHAAIQSQAVSLRHPTGRPVQTVILGPPVEAGGETKLCPFCSEQILQAAKKCKHCGEIIDITLRAADEGRRAQETTRRTSPSPAPVIVMAPQAAAPVVTQITNVTVGTTGRRWSPIIAMGLSLILPGLGQMYKGQMLNGLAWLVLTAVGYLLFVIPGLILHLVCILGAGMGNPER